MSARKTVSAFQILRGNHLNGFDQAWKIRSVRGESLDHHFAESVAARLPIPCSQFERSELHVGGKNVLVGWRQRGIKQRRYGDIEIRRLGKFTVFRGVVSAFEIINFGPDVYATGNRLAETVRADRGSQCRKHRQIAESNIHFCNGTRGAEIFYAIRESGIELRRDRKSVV